MELDVEVFVAEQEMAATKAESARKQYAWNTERTLKLAANPREARTAIRISLETVVIASLSMERSRLRLRTTLDDVACFQARTR